MARFLELILNILAITPGQPGTGRIRPIASPIHGPALSIRSSLAHRHLHIDSLANRLAQYSTPKARANGPISNMRLATGRGFLHPIPASTKAGCSFELLIPSEFTRRRIGGLHRTALTIFRWYSRLGVRRLRRPTARSTFVSQLTE